METHDNDLNALRRLLEQVQQSQALIATESTRITAILEDLTSRISKLKERSVELSGHSYHEYEFFRGSNGWHIRFAGKLVETGRNDKGFQYIHKLLMYPGRKFYPNELDPLLEGGDGYAFLGASQSFWVERDIKYQKVNPGDEVAHRNALDSLRKLKPDNLDPIETHIHYYSQMCYLADSLKNIHSLPIYIALFKEAKEKLDDLIFEFEQTADDKLFVKRVLLTSGQIRTTARDNINTTKKMRERVVKNIQNAIKSMGNPAAQAYFSDNIQIGIQSVFHPDAVYKINWLLEANE